MHPVDERPARGSTAAAISDTVVRLMSEYTGRGPTRSKTVMNRDVITVVLQDTLTKGERRLAEDGKSDIVLRMRHEFQLTMREDLISAIEMITERKVIAFMSDNHIDPDIAAEVFVLEPPAEDVPATDSPAKQETSP